MGNKGHSINYRAREWLKANKRRFQFYESYPNHVKHYRLLGSDGCQYGWVVSVRGRITGITDNNLRSQMGDSIW